MTKIFKPFNGKKYAIVLMSDPRITNTNLAIRMLKAIGINI